MSEIIDRDTETFKYEINNYKSKLNSMREKILRGEEAKSKDLIFKPDLKMLNYERYRPKKLEKKKEKPKVDMKKLFKFSQRFGNKIGRNKEKINLENENKTQEQNMSIILPFITSPSYELQNYDYNNTIGLIKDIAKNQNHIDEKFDIRKYKLEKYLKVDSLPSVDQYEEIIKEKSDKIKNERRKINEIKGKMQSEKLIEKSDIILREIEENAIKWEKRYEELEKEEEGYNK